METKQFIEDNRPTSTDRVTLRLSTLEERQVFLILELH